MSYTFEGIKIDEKKLSGNSEEISSIYMVKVGFKELIEVCGLGKVSINREVDEYRASKMVNYIKDQESFYPTILVATMKKNLISYDEKNKKIKINSEKKLQVNKDIVVIDGQHRYKSIEELLKDNFVENEKRQQSVLLLDNINEFQQRKIFIDVNDNSRKVTVGTKLRLDKNIINYVSLTLVNRIEYLHKKISMDDNQTKEFNKIPYKFIIKGNRELLGEIEKKYDSEQLQLEDIDEKMDDIINLWMKIFEIIDEGSKNKCKIVMLEAFYIAVCKKIVQDRDKDFNNNKKLDEFFSNIKKSIMIINEKFYSQNLNTIKDKINMLISLMGESYDQ